jgi:phosphatidylserine/phosphatidylglycerophosphate/cardiolipin synthase-like enzyme
MRKRVSLLLAALFLGAGMITPAQAAEEMPGQEIAFNNKKGNCLACHAMPGTKGEMPGSIAPPLIAMKLRFPDRAKLRAQIPALSAIGAGVSSQVQAQYEENPYPRWTRAPAILAPPLTLSPAGEADVIVVSGGPHHNASFIRSSFRMALAGAANSIRIVTPYFVPGPRIVRSLLRAAKRGVRIQLLLPSISDVPLIKIASRAYLSTLLKAGIEIYERQGTILHAKVMLIDSCWATLGSANLDLRSFHRNYEVNVVIDNPEFGRQIDEMFTEDLTRSRRISLQEHEKRPWIEKFLERLCDPIRRFL